MRDVTKWLASGSIVLYLAVVTSAVALHNPIIDEDVVFEEIDGVVAVEAEFFTKQTKTDIRRWYRTSAGEFPNVGMDPDWPLVANASNNAYLEILPDTRRNHGDKYLVGENFAGEPGTMAQLHYLVYFNTPGRYYVWARAYSTGSEDNGLHVGMDGTWPASGQGLQWCVGKRTWRWESKQRTDENNCGEPYKIYLDVEAGLHEITFSMREDGFEFDKWFMTQNREFPVIEAGDDVEEVVANGKMDSSSTDLEFGWEEITYRQVAPQAAPRAPAK